MRLSDSNLKSYIAQNYPGATYVCAKTYYHRPYLLQKNFGGLNDCTLTSITYCISKYYPNKKNIYVCLYNNIFDIQQLLLYDFYNNYFHH